MKNIVIPKPVDKSLIAQLLSLYYSFKNVSYPENLLFDLSRLNWISPLIILPLTAYLDTTTGSNYLKNQESNIQNYLDIINFPKGISTVNSFQQMIQSEKSYIPISILKRESGSGREKLESLFSSMIYKTLGSVKGAQNAVYYPISELVTNIFEHSKQDNGFIFGQFYPNKKYLDICIVDCGRGLAKAYLDEKNLEFSDRDAIGEVMKGNSIKSNKERGYGVRTSQRVVCEGFGGEFILISGSAALISKKKEIKLATMPDFYWKGVIIAYRIPKQDKAIDITPYIE